MMTMELFWVAAVAGMSGAVAAFVVVGLISWLSRYF